MYIAWEPESKTIIIDGADVIQFVPVKMAWKAVLLEKGNADLEELIDSMPPSKDLEGSIDIMLALYAQGLQQKADFVLREKRDAHFLIHHVIGR